MKDDPYICTRCRKVWGFDDLYGTACDWPECPECRGTAVPYTNPEVQR